MLNRHVMEVLAFEVVAGVPSALHIREVIALRATSQDYCFISVVCLIGSCFELIWPSARQPSAMCLAGSNPQPHSGDCA